MRYQPQIEVASIVVTDVKIRLPEFTLEVDGDIDSEYIGVFEGPSHDISFYGPTAEHVIGVAHRYAAKLTEGAPYNLLVVIDDEDVEESLVTLP
jgi:hypothetical protein